MSRKRKEEGASPAPRETGSVLEEEYKRLVEDYTVLRASLRDSLSQAGILSNPAWSDADIAAAVARGLGVTDKYTETRMITKALKQGPHPRRKSR